jgi:zinc/manganese transport system permease protein
VVFAEVAVIGGIVASLDAGLPISPFVASIAFVIYVVCRALGALRTRRRATRATIMAG